MHNSQVYIITGGPYIKIGMSGNLNDRLITLQVGCPFQQELVWLSDKRSKQNAEAIEKLIHNRFSHNHTRGEWFDTNPYWAIEHAKKIEKEYMATKAEDRPYIPNLHSV